MNKTVDSRELRTRFVTYLRQVLAGTTIRVNYQGKDVAELRPLAGTNTDILEQFLACLDERAWSAAYALIEKMPESLARSARVRQQHGFALNREGRSEAAEKVLLELLQEEGPSTETCGILGRVYKDRWQAARKAGRTQQARQFLEQAIETYLQGHRANPENPYPGINALTLISHNPGSFEDKNALEREVSQAVETRKQAPDQGYWDYATRLELAVHSGDDEEARQALVLVMGAKKGEWMAESTQQTFQAVREIREERGEPAPGWLRFAEAALEGAGPKSVADELTKIEGVGAKSADLLKAAGVRTFTDLALTDLSRLQQILADAGFRLADPRTWSEQAELAAAGRWDELYELQDQLVVGRRRI